MILMQKRGKTGNVTENNMINKGEEDRRQNNSRLILSKMITRLRIMDTSHVSEYAIVSTEGCIASSGRSTNSSRFIATSVAECKYQGL